ncbi:MAG: hypothetical protein HY22_04195 [[Candidatus Thermochlorobacteriaceae] bacterium GBChlB]|nr:MAG: hypothetical protein HY22_04195 [[Candidatus Thermochlorobacteriaceae] bacterium GBChlB]
MEGSNINRRLTDLEAILGEYMAQNALAARRAQLEQAQRDKEAKEFKDEMKEFKTQTLIYQARLEETTVELKQSVKDLNKKWGELSNKLGTIVEDIVAPNLPSIAEKYFGLKNIERMMLNIYVSSQKPDVIGREFDAILVSGETVVLNETKSTVRQNYMEEFIEMLPEFFDYFPELQGKKIIPIFSSLSLNPAQVAFLTKRGVYAMAMSGNTMDILNYDDVARA